MVAYCAFQVFLLGKNTCITHALINFDEDNFEIKPWSYNHVHLGLNFQSDASRKLDLHIPGTYEKACTMLDILRMLQNSFFVVH